MADFEKAFGLIVEDWEGSYDNDPDDGGAETVFGITRKYQPAWKGWVRFDSLVNGGMPPKIAALDTILGEDVRDYYKILWLRLGLGDVVSQALANCIYGGCINQGQARVISWLQDTLNELGAAINHDGAMGPATVQACNSCEASLVLAGLKSKRKKAYEFTAAKRPNNAKFLKGWLNRLNAGA